MLALLDRSYPFRYQGRNTWLICLGILGIGFWFLHLFAPFDVACVECKYDYGWICLIHAVTVTGIVGMVLTLGRWATKDQAYWTIGKAALLLLMLNSVAITRASTCKHLNL